MQFHLTPPEDQRIDARNVQDLLPLWQRDIARRTSKKTGDTYLSGIMPFFNWWGQHGDRYEWMLSEDSIFDFQDWLNNTYKTARGKSPNHNGQANCFNRLRHFFRWAVNTGRADLDCTRWVPSVNYKAKVSRLLTVEALVRLLQGADGGLKPARDRAIIALYAGTGARSVEVFHAKWDPGFLILNEDGSGGSILYAVTKLDRPRRAVFGPNTAHCLRLWQLECGKSMGRIIGTDISHQDMLYEIISRNGLRAGLEMVGGHDIRKLFCSYWYRNYPPDDGRAQFFLALQVGHSTGENVTTKHYINSTAEDLLPFYVSPFETPEVEACIRSWE